MGIFRTRTRTTKSVGEGIGTRLKRIKVKEKRLRTLEKEGEVKERERQLNIKIAQTRAKHPSGFKRFVKVAAITSKAGFKTGKQIGRGISKFSKKRGGII